MFLLQLTYSIFLTNKERSRRQFADLIAQIISCTCLQIMDFNFLTGMREGKFVAPPWLAHLAGDAQVEVNCLRVLQAFVAPSAADGGTDLNSLIKSTTGNMLSSIGDIRCTKGSIMSTTGDIRLSAAAAAGQRGNRLR